MRVWMFAYMGGGGTCMVHVGGECAMYDLGVCMRVCVYICVCVYMCVCVCGCMCVWFVCVHIYKICISQP